MLRTQITAQPSAEPVSLAEAKAHMRIDVTDDDTLIEALITAVRQHAETVTRRALVTQSWVMAMDTFPNPAMNIGSANWYGPQWGASPGPLTTLQQNGVTGYEIFMPNAPLQTIDSITYANADTGVMTTLDPSQYVIDLIGEPARVVPAYGTVWPNTRNTINAVQVAFTCGYGAPDKVPQAIKNWMLLRMAALYENREEIIVAQRIVIGDLPFVDGMIEAYRVVKF